MCQNTVANMIKRLKIPVFDFIVGSFQMMNIFLFLFIIAVPQDDSFVFKTERRVPKTGIMLVSFNIIHSLFNREYLFCVYIILYCHVPLR